jgi:predicted Zn-dependent peptidase
MAAPTIPRSHKDYIPLRIAVMALGGYFGSRLMTSIREEKGLTYGISAALEGSHEAANITINAQCDPAYVDEVISQTFAEIERLANEPMPREELEALIQYLSSALAVTLDSPLSIADHYITQLTVGTPPDYFEQQFNVLGAITPATIAEMTSKYIKPELFATFVAGREGNG